ncbi:MAG: hypothetical protein H3C62_12560 [Gemmatimonadaceae bacterium]|nr:hypothetical protein [Gemmatimonadaceae bacterium]
MSPERERQLKFAAGTLYLGVAVTLAAGLVYPRVQQGMLTRENGALASDTLALASDMLNLRNLQDETNLMVAKRSALAQLEAARTDGARVFAATSRAISRSQVEVWLTQLKSISRLEVEYEGSGRSPTAIASFLEGLRADTAVRGVALRKMTRHPKEGTWSFLAKVLLAPPQAVAPPAVPSTSPAPLGGPAAPAPGSTR